MNKYPFVRECGICGKPFLIVDATKIRQKYCGADCRREHARISKSNSRERIKLRKEMEGEKKKVSVVDFAVEARQHGMTYGQWQAQQYIKQQRRNR